MNLKSVEGPAKVLLSKRLFGTLGRVAGRTISAVSWGYTIYEVGKAVNRSMKHSPVQQEIEAVRKEYIKWSSAISCIGRDAYHENEMASIHEGGAITYLGKRELINWPDSRNKQEPGRPQTEYHHDPTSLEDAIKKEDKRILNPDPKMAKELVNRSITYVIDAENVINMYDYVDRKENIIKRLRNADDKINPDYVTGVSYLENQKELYGIVQDMIFIESEFKSYLHQLEQEKSKMNWKDVGKAAIGAAVGTATVPKFK